MLISALWQTNHDAVSDVLSAVAALRVAVGFEEAGWQGFWTILSRAEIKGCFLVFISWMCYLCYLGCWAKQHKQKELNVTAFTHHLFLWILFWLRQNGTQSLLYVIFLDSLGYLKCRFKQAAFSGGMFCSRALYWSSLSNPPVIVANQLSPRRHIWQVYSQSAVTQTTHLTGGQPISCHPDETSDRSTISCSVFLVWFSKRIALSLLVIQAYYIYKNPRVSLPNYGTVTACFLDGNCPRISNSTVHVPYQ